jgi:hypothetical protein
MFSNVRSFARCVAVLACLLTIGLELPAVAAEPLDSAASLPTVYLPLSMQPRVTWMLRRSETFREQCQRLSEAPALIVSVQVDPALATGIYRARTIFRRYNSGVLLAYVSVGPGAKQTEWLAHEFDHILEQLDGVDLRALALHGREGVWFSGPDVIESERATRAGRAVLEESRRPIQPSDKLVE